QDIRSLFIDFFAAVLLPGEDVKAELFQVALVVPRQFTDGGFYAVLVQPLSDLDWVVLAHTFNAFSDSRSGRECGQLESAARVTVFILKRFDDVGVGGVVGEVGGQRYQHAVNRSTGNGVDIRVTHALMAHELNVQALLGALAQPQTHYGALATVVDDNSSAATDFRDDGGVIAVARVDTFKHRHFDIGFLKRVAHSGGNALTVRLFVVQNSDSLRLDGFNNELGSGRALLIVAPNGAENHFII